VRGARRLLYDDEQLCCQCIHPGAQPNPTEPKLEPPRELHKRWSAEKLPLVAVACHPGVIPSSELFRYSAIPWVIQAPLQLAFTPLFKVRAGGVTAVGGMGGESQPLHLTPLPDSPFYPPPPPPSHPSNRAEPGTGRRDPDLPGHL
jgi:hypothetical protein